jgi:hypothetical protein
MKASVSIGVLEEVSQSVNPQSQRQINHLQPVGTPPHRVSAFPDLVIPTGHSHSNPEPNRALIAEFSAKSIVLHHEFVRVLDKFVG